MRVKDSRDDKPQETECRNALPLQFTISRLDEALLDEMPNVLEQLSEFTGKNHSVSTWHGREIKAQRTLDIRL